MSEVFPIDVSYGSRGGPGFLTHIVALPESGQEQRVARRSQKKHQWNAAYGVKSHTQLAQVRDFYVAHLGPAIEFKYLDYLDCSSAPSFMGTELSGGVTPTYNDVVIGTADGSTTTFQLVKRYHFGSLIQTVKITKPIADTVRIGVNNIEQTSGWSVNDETGVVTFTTAPTTGDVTAGFRHYWPARFSKEVDELFDLTIEDFATGGVEILIVEVLDGSAVPGEYLNGGSYTHDPFTANVTISRLQGLVHVFRNVNAGLSAILPAKATMTPGHSQFYLVHADTTGNNFTLEDGDTSSTIYTATPGSVAEVILSDDGAGTYTWYVI